MIRRPPSSTRTDTLFPDTTLFRSDIGNAATDMTERMAAGILQADGSMRVEPRMDVKQVARAVRQMADLPLDVNVQFMQIMASGMPRSEEHTTELQSLMRISYAVFCLKKKNTSLT